MQKLGVFLHLYHRELWDELHVKLTKLALPVHLCVNLADEDQHNIEPIKNKILNAYPDADIIVTENRGKDIGGHLHQIDRWLKTGREYDYILFCHTKKKSTQWRRNLYAAVFDCGKNGLGLLKSEDSVGMVGSGDWLMKEHKCDSHRQLDEYIKKLKLKRDKEIQFIGGTIFWVKADIYKAFFTKHPPLEFYKRLEVGDMNEPSYTHAFERLLGLIVTQTHEIRAIDTTKYLKRDKFNEALYLELYEDVKNAVKKKVFLSAWEHFRMYGKYESRVASFDESIYVGTYSDVLTDIDKGLAESPIDHYIKFGYVAGRIVNDDEI